MGITSVFYKVCPSCKSLLLSEVCCNCGFAGGEASVDLENGNDFVVPPTQLDDPVSENIDEPVISVFQKINPEFKQSAPKSTSMVGKIILIVLMFLALAASAGFTYWSYTYRYSSFIEPVSTSSAQTGSVNGNSDSAELSSQQKTIDLNLNLKEGNFVKYDLAQFAEADKNVFLQMFGLKDYVDRFISNKVFEKLGTDLKLKEDDTNVYLTEKFAFVFNSDSFTTWGLVTGVKNKEIAEEKIKLFEAKKAAQLKTGTSKLKEGDIDYTKYFVRLVELDEQKANIEPASTAITAVTPAEDKNIADASASNKEFYLLVSNSKEFLDRMKELSEGTVPNLAGAAIYAQAQKDLPAVGAMSVYKASNSPSWNTFSEWFATKFDYIGFDKILKSVKSSNSVLYAKDNKLKIIEMNDF